MRVIVDLHQTSGVDDVRIARKAFFGVESVCQSAITIDIDAGAGIETRRPADEELFNGPRELQRIIAPLDIVAPLPEDAGGRRVGGGKDLAPNGPRLRRSHAELNACGESDSILDRTLTVFSDRKCVLLNDVVFT